MGGASATSDGSGGRAATDALVRDLQSLLSRAVRELRETTDAGASAAWALRESGVPYVAAASFAGPAPPAPDADDFAAAASLHGATDLSQRRLPRALRELARHHRCAALAPVRASGGAALAVLLLGHSEHPARAPDPGRPRPGTDPRSLAALDAAAEALAAPLAAALAAGRLRQLGREVCRLDRLAALGTLCAEIAHEIRNPLVSLKTFLQLLPERHEDPEFLQRFAGVVSGELARMERLLDCVIAHGVPPAPESAREPALLPPVLRSLAELLRHRALKVGVALEVAVPSELPPVALSEDRLRQVVLNLALNAIDATPGGGTVRMRGQASADGVELRVCDEGPGIAEEQRETVFEPFSARRRERPGGLGLAITRRIVSEAGGRIEVGKGAAGGAEFCVQLPAL